MSPAAISVLQIGPSNRILRIGRSPCTIPMASSTHVNGTVLRHAYAYYVIIRNRVRRIRLQNVIVYVSRELNLLIAM